MKVLRPELASTDARPRFVQEARAAAHVRHDHVVTVFAVAGPTDGVPYFAMELLTGPSLAELIRSGPGLPPCRAADLWLRRPRAWPPPMPPGWSTATSSPPTFCSIR